MRDEIRSMKPPVSTQSRAEATDGVEYDQEIRKNRNDPKESLMKSHEGR
jgi:hypothetical protein